MAPSQYIRSTISSGAAEPPASSQFGLASLKVSQICRMQPGPLRSARTLVSPGAMYLVRSALPVKLGSVEVTARDRPGLSFMSPSRSWAAANVAKSAAAATKVNSFL